MQKIGDYEYPDLGSFKEALDVAEEAMKKHGGIIPNKEAAEKLGYTIKDPKRIAGHIYKKLADLTMFGLFEKIRGGYRTTNLADRALDPYDSEKANEGKAEAIRNIRIVGDCFTKWRATLPSENAFPAELTKLFENVSWKEAQRHAETLRNLFIEAFPYLEVAGDLTQTDVSSRSEARSDVDLGRLEGEKETGASDLIGELRTVDYGILRLRDAISIDMAIRLLESLKEKIQTQKAD